MGIGILKSVEGELRRLRFYKEGRVSQKRERERQRSKDMEDLEASISDHRQDRIHTLTHSSFLQILDYIYIYAYTEITHKK